MTVVKVETNNVGDYSGVLPDKETAASASGRENCKEHSSDGEYEHTSSTESNQPNLNPHGEAVSSEGTQEFGKKRGRLSASEKENANRKRMKATCKTSDTAKEITPMKKSSRGRKPAGSADAWTDEQEAYLRQLFTNSNKPTIAEVHRQFEEKYTTGRSQNGIKLRWYSIKTKSLVLTPNEEHILKKAVEKYENNKAAAVLDTYTKEGGANVTKLTQKFVAMKLKEWDKGGIDKAQLDVADTNDESDDN
ncbi:hypothetical protein TWF696_009431 [Orbilia brochopaga]|uniref:Myb-like domain-containing protein n=1 Tax=Orbilia brochopaga TaxID=3140254 RepID=A0AAV9UF21_9PEZI